MTDPLLSIADAQAELIETFEALPDWQERYQYIIELGQALPPLPTEFQTDAYKVRGCQSQVWIAPEVREGHLHFQAGSDAIITAGLIAVLLSVYNARTPKEILTTPPDFIKAIGLSQHLSPSRSNGLLSMVRRIFDAASAAAGEDASVHG
ncbi:SufE family protein [Elstera sp.]|jgi:cysteine desulfuration protein SufE|uniref:SufE family protein n=1 Tax=Elstera sp. TaxID=1916664 RepID=UPI0037C117AC